MNSDKLVLVYSIFVRQLLATMYFAVHVVTFVRAVWPNSMYLNTVNALVGCFLK